MSHYEKQYEKWMDERLSPVLTNDPVNNINPRSNDNLGNSSESDQAFKADGGKLKPSLLHEGMPRALMAVAAVLTYGAEKYEAHSWKRVDIERYKDALLRHQSERCIDHSSTDEESGLLHLAHEACNILFLLETACEKMGNEAFRNSLKFNNPPTDHKR